MGHGVFIYGTKTFSAHTARNVMEGLELALFVKSSKLTAPSDGID